MPSLALFAQEAASATTQSLPKASIDTSLLVFSYLNTPETTEPATDTLPGTTFRIYDPARRQPIDWGTLGNLGSAARPLWLTIEPRRGFALGVRPFDLYRMRPETLRFYRHSRTFSEASFSRGQTQNDGMATATVSRTFSRGLNFSMDYRTINNLGQFRQQQTKHSSLSAGIWYPINRRYEFFLIYTSNTFRQKDSGGIVSDTVFGSGDQFSGPFDAAIRLQDEGAKTRQTDWNLNYTHYLKFGNPEKRVFRAAHTLSTGRESFKFAHAFDDAAGDFSGDSAFYGALMTDTRGLRNYVTVSRLDNTFLLSSYKSVKTGRPTDGFAAGIRHSYFNLTQEPLPKRDFSNFFLTGNFAITPSNRFGLVTQGDLGLFDNAGEYQVRADMLLGLGVLGQLRGSLLSQRRPPDLLQTRAYASKRLLWNNSFNKVIENSFTASYALPRIGFEAIGRTHTITNYIFYNQASVPVQLSGTFSVSQLLLTENLKLGPVRLDNTIGFQAFTNTDVLHLPKWFSKNSVYFSGKLFKGKMLTNIGADFRINSEFTPDAYQPLTGQFHLQDTVQQLPYPWLDLFLTVKIQSFRLYARYENITALFNPEKVYYQTAWHPQNFNSIRIGISWRFMDNNLKSSDDGTQQQGPPTGVGGGSGPSGRIPKF